MPASRRSRPHLAATGPLRPARNSLSAPPEALERRVMPAHLVVVGAATVSYVAVPYEGDPGSGLTTLPSLGVGKSATGGLTSPPDAAVGYYSEHAGLPLTTTGPAFAYGAVELVSATFGQSGGPYDMTLSTPSDITFQVVADPGDLAGMPIDIEITAQAGSVPGGVPTVPNSGVTTTLRVDGTQVVQPSGGYLLATTIGATFRAGFTGVAVGEAGAHADLAYQGGLNLALLFPEVTPTLARSKTGDGGVDVGYAIANADLTAPVPINLYWSPSDEFDPTIDSLIGPAVATSETAEGTYGPDRIAASVLKNRPLGKDYLLAVADPDNQASPASSDKVASLQMPTIESVDDSLESASGEETSAPFLFDAFGPFLQGVPITDTFTLSTDDGEGVISKILYTIGDQEPKAAKSVGSGDWTFDPGVAALPTPGGTADTDDPLSITTYDAHNNPLQTYTATLSVENDLQTILDVTPPGGPADGEDVAGLRFLQGVPLPSQFSGTIPDLPYYYQPYLQVEFGGKPLAQAPHVTDVSGDPSGEFFTFNYDPQYLAGDVNVFPVFRMPDGTIVSPPGPAGDTSATLHSEPLPAWMTVKDASWDPAAQDYAIHLTFPSMLQFDSDLSAAITNPELEELTSGTDLTSSFGVGVDMTVTAALTNDPGDARLTVDDWFADARFLGNDLFDESDTLSPKLLDVTADLNPDTLKAVNGITITTSTIDLLSLLSSKPAVFDAKFGTGSHPFVIPVSPPLSAVTGNLSFGGEFQAAATTLDLTASLDFDLSGPTPTIDPAHSSVELVARGNASLVLNVSPGFSLLNTVPLVNILATAGASVVADADLIVNFSGPASAPVAALDKARSTAGLTLGVGYDLTAAFLAKAKAGDLMPGSHPVATTPLFNLNPPAVTPSFAFLDDLILAGAARLQQAGRLDLGPAPALPTSPILPQLQLATPDLARAVPDEAAATPAVTPAGEVTVTTPVYSTTDGLSFGLQVLADHATLTDGHHFLDTVLLDPAGDATTLSQLDLADYKLAADSNPLGFASGTETISIPVDTASLTPGVPYQLQFRLINDRASTAQAVEVALQDLSTTELAPRLAVSSPSGAVGGVLTFAPGSGSATVDLANTGTTGLVIDSATFDGTGFELVDPLPALGIALNPGESADLVVQPVDPGEPADATLRIASDDPTQATTSLALSYAGPPPTVPPSSGPPPSVRTSGPVLSPVAEFAVDPGSPVVFTEAATDPGYTVTYGLAPGYPAGAMINPATGAFTWTPPAPGTYAITILAIDDGPGLPRQQHDLRGRRRLPGPGRPPLPLAGRARPVRGGDDPLRPDPRAGAGRPGAARLDRPARLGHLDRPGRPRLRGVARAGGARRRAFDSRIQPRGGDLRRLDPRGEGGGPGDGLRRGPRARPGPAGLPLLGRSARQGGLPRLDGDLVRPVGRASAPGQGAGDAEG